MGLDNRERAGRGAKRFKGQKPCYVQNAVNRWQMARDFAEIAANR
jgi:hypothetical protein